MNAWDREICARTLWAEARGEGEFGMNAVAHVILNRFKAKKWYSAPTVAGVCLKDRQFSSWNECDKTRQAMADCPVGDPILEKARTIVASLEVTDDPTEGATHYFSTTLVQPPNWAGSATFTVQIGKHKFFKDVP